ncbi:MAG: UbiD family decarboxylase [Desulfarculaceae bacterium]|nr:UbiD family decarboxylase [Desulfarculaceae bacterium]MCF8046059.1 UbiD family decarboxylase [Desulfarculaceae bacterium]MCF8064154.1 UbiD family decarboxylase [Desulfarculaceae bacterium]MCF8098524.1 UbiD family decarboxylase [Desulfarculaceae bacterium]MCF8121231.1 UbiD family decarboxylase [Desulfarculaceae bacterium]
MAMNLASWLDRLAAEAPEELVTVRRPVEPAAFESAAVVDALEHQKRYPAVLFEQVRDLEGRPTDCRILNNTFGTFKKIALALGMDTDQRMPIMERMLELSGRSLEPVITDPAQAPVRHWAQQGDDVDLTRLPLIRHTELDGGPYLTPIVVSRTPQGRYNVSWNRMQYLDPTHLAIYMSPRHLSSYFAEAEAAGRDLPIAVVLGHHPAFHLTGALLTPLDADEYAVAGAVMGQPLELIPSLSFGQELLIPAQAELVLEGRILAGKRCVEGPFGEFTGYAGPQRLSWVVEISAVYGKACPTIIDIFPCYTEHINAHLPIEASIYQRAKQAVPGVVKTCWVGSGGPFNLIISLTKKTEGEPMRAAMAAISASNFIKHVIVVDDDVDPEDLTQVMWAFSSRVQADQDLSILRNLQGQVLDPSLRHEIKTSGMVIDATRPLDRPFPRRGEVPEQLRQNLNLDDYLEG